MDKALILGAVALFAAAGYFVLKPKHHAPIGAQHIEAEPTPTAPNGSPTPETTATSSKPSQAAPPSSPAAKMSEDEFKHQMQSQLEKSVKDGLSAEEAKAQMEFLNVTLKGFNMDARQREEVNGLIKEMSDQIDRAGNDAQRERIYQENAARLEKIIGAPNK